MENVTTDSESEEEMEVELAGDANNNATLTVGFPSSTGATGSMEAASASCHSAQGHLLDNACSIPGGVDANPGMDNKAMDGVGNGEKTQEGLMQSIAIMQKLVLKKGLIDKPINKEEINELLGSEADLELPCAVETEAMETAVGRMEPPPKKSIIPKPKIKSKVSSRKDDNPIVGSESEVTIYKRAVQQVAPDLDAQIEQYISNVRKSSEDNRNKSSSFEELMDTSDESEPTLIPNNSIPGVVTAVHRQVVGAGSLNDPRFSSMQQELPVSQEEQLNQFLKDAEREVEGKALRSTR